MKRWFCCVRSDSDGVEQRRCRGCSCCVRVGRRRRRRSHKCIDTAASSPPVTDTNSNSAVVQNVLCIVKKLILAELQGRWATRALSSVFIALSLQSWTLVGSIHVSGRVGSQKFPSWVGRVGSSQVSKMSNKYALEQWSNYRIIYGAVKYGERWRAQKKNFLRPPKPSRSHSRGLKNVVSTCTYTCIMFYTAISVQKTLAVKHLQGSLQLIRELQSTK